MHYCFKLVGGVLISEPVDYLNVHTHTRTHAHTHTHTHTHTHQFPTNLDDCVVVRIIILLLIFLSSDWDSNAYTLLPWQLQ